MPIEENEVCISVSSNECKLRHLYSHFCILTYQVETSDKWCPSGVCTGMGTV